MKTIISLSIKELPNVNYETEAVVPTIILEFVFDPILAILVPDMCYFTEST